jgi:uncharacterized protein YggE
VRFGTVSQNSQASAAQAKVNEIMQKALEGIEKAGVPKKAIRTSGLTLSPVYSEQKVFSSTEKITAFRANNTIEVTLDDLKLVGKVIDAGIAAGANELQGVSFRLKNDLPQRSAALAMAAEEARDKAKTIGKALDVRLAGVMEVTESGVRSFYPSDSTGGARMMSLRGGTAPTSVEPGELRVQASVTVRYEILPVVR